MTLRCRPTPQLQPCRTGPPVDREGGFTLIELLVSLTILGLALALIAGYKPPWSRGLGLPGPAAGVARRAASGTVGGDPEQPRGCIRPRSDRPPLSRRKGDAAALAGRSFARVA